MPTCQENIGVAFRFDKREKTAYLISMGKDDKRRKSALDRIIGANVARLLDEAGIKKNPFAEKIGMDDGGLRHLIAGRSRWNSWHLEVIADALGVNPERLIIGQDEVRDRQHSYNVSTYGPITPTILIASEIDTKPNVELQDYYAAPLIDGKIAAGEGREIGIGDIKNLVWIYAPALRDRRRHNLIAIEVDKVSGDSMFPTIFPGDIVLVDRDEPGNDVALFRSSRVYAIRDGDGGCAVKRIYKDDGNGVLVIGSDNRSVAPRVAWTQNISKLIIGRVVWGWRDLMDV